MKRRASAKHSTPGRKPRCSRVACGTIGSPCANSSEIFRYTTWTWLVKRQRIAVSLAREMSGGISTCRPRLKARLGGPAWDGFRQTARGKGSPRRVPAGGRHGTHTGDRLGGGAGGGTQRADRLTGTFMVNTKRWPSRLTFLDCCGLPTKGPGNLKRSLGVPA